MFDHDHVLAYSPQIAHNGEMLVELERNLQVDFKHLKNRSSWDFLSSGKTILIMRHHGS